MTDMEHKRDWGQRWECLPSLYVPTPYAGSSPGPIAHLHRSRCGRPYPNRNDSLALRPQASGLSPQPCPQAFPDPEQVLSRFHMFEQKLTVSRRQAVVQVLADGTAALTSCGRGPTLWRARGGAWVALQLGDSLLLTDGDQVSVDCNDPEGAVFTCQEQSAAQQGGGYSQQNGGYEQQGGGGYSQLPYPWEQLVDVRGAAYYYQPQTGQSSWNAPA